MLKPPERMKTTQLDKLSLPLSMAQEYVILATAAGEGADRDHYVRKLVKRLEDVAFHLGMKLGPAVDVTE